MYTICKALKTPSLPDQTRKKNYITSDKGKKQTEAAIIIYRTNIYYLNFTYYSSYMNYNPKKPHESSPFLQGLNIHSWHTGPDTASYV